jgi:hypothetical protein
MPYIMPYIIGLYLVTGVLCGAIGTMEHSKQETTFGLWLERIVILVITSFLWLPLIGARFYSAYMYGNTEPYTGD